jgi:hypothetical protein
MTVHDEREAYCYRLIVAHRLKKDEKGIKAYAFKPGSIAG